MEEKEERKAGRKKFWFGFLAGVLTTAFLGLGIIVVAAGVWIMTVRPVQAVDQAGTEADGLNTGRIASKLTYIQTLIDKYYLQQDGEEQDMEEAEDFIYTAYVYSLGDPYSAYYNKEESASLEEENSGEYCGIGVQISQNIKTGLITIVRVFKDSPAEEAGMLPGDIVYKVDGEPVTGEDLSLLVKNNIKGEEGTTVKIEVYRGEEAGFVEMDMRRRMVQDPTVESEMLEDQIGYIAVSSFEEVTVEQFKKAVDELSSQGMEGLVIDMRNNGGGLVQSAREMADYLLADEKDGEPVEIVTFKGKGVPDSTFYCKDGHQVDIPITVLVNGQSASSSEIFTGAMQDNGAATIVGTTTFGKGIAQGVFNMADGSSLKLTTAYYYVPSGKCIHEIGIEPDVEIELAPGLANMVEVPKDEDNQLNIAVDVITEGLEAAKSQALRENEANASEETPDESAVQVPWETGPSEE